MTTPKRKPRSADAADKIADELRYHGPRAMAFALRKFATEAVAQERAEWLAAVEANLRGMPGEHALDAKLEQARGAVKRGGTK